MIVTIFIISVIVISLGYGIYFSDPMLGNMMMVHYALGGALLSAIIRRYLKSLWKWYTIFFVVYAVYLFFIQINLEGYYGNPDEGAFFGNSTNALNYGWSQLPNITFYKSFYGQYPAAMLLFSAISKIGHEAGVENLRLLGRFHLLVMGSGIMAMVCAYMEEMGYTAKRTLLYAVILGLGSYVLLETCNYTRDIHVMFLYTIVGYKLLTTVNKVNFVEIFLISVLMVFVREENGLLCFIFLGAWAYLRGLISKKVVAAVAVIAFMAAMVRMMITFTATSAWADAHEGTGLFAVINNMPLVLRPFLFSMFMLFQPFPFYNMMADVHTGSYLAFPMMFSPVLLMYIVWVTYKSYRVERNRDFILFLIFVGYFVLVSFLSPVYRRAVLMLPCTYMLFLKRQDLVDTFVKKQGLKCFFLIWGSLNVTYILFDLLRNS